MITVTVRVLRAEPDPAERDPFRRWLVTCESADAPDGLELLVHSPALAFGEPGPAGRVYRLELAGPLTRPYAGSFTATPVTG